MLKYLIKNPTFVVIIHNPTNVVYQKMKESAHFIQFLSFSFGLLALYIVYNLKKNHKSKIVNSYFYFLLGINLIVFIHVLEAFFKLIIEPDIYDSFLRIFFIYMILPLSLVRLLMTSKIINFGRLWNKQSGVKYLDLYALGLFGIFFLITFVLVFDKSVDSKIDEYSILIVHVLLNSAIIYSAFKISSKKDITIKKLFTVILIFYAFFQLILRLPVYNQFTFEHTQMVLLGFLDLLFNATQIFIIKKIFVNTAVKFGKTSSVKKSDIFKKYNITKREQEIISLICEGKTNKEIAAELFISPTTVRDHNSNIFQKVNVKNRTEVALLFNKYL